MAVPGRDLFAVESVARAYNLQVRHLPHEYAGYRPGAAAVSSRVIFVNRYFHPDLSATSQILYDLTRRLQQAGIEVHVVCSRQLYEDAKADLPARDCVDGVQVHRVCTTNLGRSRMVGRALDYLSFYCSCTKALLRLLRSGDVLVAKTDPPLISVPAVAVARLRGAALINWLQDIFPEVATRLGASPLPACADAVLRGARDVSLRAAQANIVIGTQMRDYVARRGLEPSRIHVIENWADQGSDHIPPPRTSHLRARLGLEDHFVVQYSGNLGRAHDFRTILGAAARLAGQPQIVFLMIGGGANMNLLQEAAVSSGLRNMQFLPYQPRADLADCLAAADVHLACLLPQLEGLIVPSKVYGVLAAARPLVFIGSAEGEIARIIRSGRCGVTVGCGDEDALANTLLQFQANPDELLDMGSRARELFLNAYTADRAAAQWLDVLGKLGPDIHSGGTHEKSRRDSV